MGFSDLCKARALSGLKRVVRNFNTSLAQLKIGLKKVFDGVGAWKMLTVPDWRLAGWRNLYISCW